MLHYEVQLKICLDLGAKVKLSVNQKIEMLSYNDINYITPLYFALFYTIIFPLFNAIFYFITLNYKRLMNYIKQKIQDITPLPQEEANKIIKENMDWHPF